jgi:hypothetical protein
LTLRSFLSLSCRVQEADSQESVVIRCKSSCEERTRYLTRMEEQLGTLPLVIEADGPTAKKTCVGYASLVARPHRALPLPTIHASDLHGSSGPSSLSDAWLGPPHSWKRRPTQNRDHQPEGRYHEEGGRTSKGWQPGVHNEPSAHLRRGADQRPVPRVGQKKAQAGSETFTAHGGSVFEEKECDQSMTVSGAGRVEVWGGTHGGMRATRSVGFVFVTHGSLAVFIDVGGMHRHVM